MIVYDCDRFGLSQLHQIRGRIGRGEYESYCILVSNNKSDDFKKRIEIICNSTDGFYISEQDFLLRGYGEIFGSRQSGFVDFNFNKDLADYDIFIKSKEYAEGVVNNTIKLDPIERNKIESYIDSFINSLNGKIVLN